jgi:outer membrane biosynthesis protein TonB
MRNESTAIVNLVDLVKQRPLPVTTDDDELFGGVARFDPMAMPVVAEPVSLPQFDQQRVRISPPLGVRREQEAPQTALLKKLAIPTGIFVGAMVVLSIYLAKRGDEKPQVAANVTVVHAPPPAPAPVVQPIDTPSPTVQPIEEAAPIAEAAPVAAPVAEEAKPTFEPTVPEVNAAPVEEQVAEKPVAKKTNRAKRAAKRAKSATRVAVAEKPKATKQNLGGNGALSVSSSHAREVWVDGRNTKSMTPQRLTLKPGTHNITLFDKKTRSAKTFQVEIKPNELTRVAKKY